MTRDHSSSHSTIDYSLQIPTNDDDIIAVLEQILQWMESTAILQNAEMQFKIN